MIGQVNLGTSNNYVLLALGQGISDSGPLTGEFTVNGDVGVVTSGEKFSASGSVVYNGQVFLHSGVTYNSSASGVPQPTTGAAVDSALEQAKLDALAASNFASGLAATASYGKIDNNFTISQAAVGNYVFNIDEIKFSGEKSLTLSAPAGSTFVLNITDAIVLTSGSINVAGGLTAANVLINYTGDEDIRFSGGGNKSQVFGTILAPNATVGLHPGLVVGSIIADKITMSSGAVVVPEVTPGSVIIGFMGLVVAFASRRTLMAKLRAVTVRQ